MNRNDEIIRSRQNRRVVELCKLTDRKAREATKKFRFDGIKLLEEAIKNPPPHDFDYFRSFAEAYDHILTIDTHKPFTDPAVRGVVERISPEYLCHELSAKDNDEKAEFTRLQNAVLDGKV